MIHLFYNYTGYHKHSDITGYHFLSLDGDCYTIASSGGNNPDPNKKCIFPFRYQGKEFTKCTKYDNNGVFWCATQVDSDGEYVSHSNKWGVCAEECPKEGKHIIEVLLPII